MDRVAYDPTAWQAHAPVANLEASYTLAGWDGPGAYRQATVEARL